MAQTHSETFEKPWAKAESPFTSLDNFNELLWEALNELNGRKDYGPETEPQLIKWWRIHDWNRQARNYNGAIDSSKIRLKPLIDVFNGNHIADFPASIEDLEGLGYKSPDKVHNILIALGTEESFLHDYKEPKPDTGFQPVSSTIKGTFPPRQHQGGHRRPHHHRLNGGGGTGGPQTTTNGSNGIPGDGGKPDVDPATNGAPPVDPLTSNGDDPVVPTEPPAKGPEHIDYAVAMRLKK